MKGGKGGVREWAGRMGWPCPSHFFSGRYSFVSIKDVKKVWYHFKQSIQSLVHSNFAVLPPLLKGGGGRTTGRKLDDKFMHCYLKNFATFSQRYGVRRCSHLCVPIEMAYIKGPISIPRQWWKVRFGYRQSFTPRQLSKENRPIE